MRNLKVKNEQVHTYDRRELHFRGCTREGIFHASITELRVEPLTVRRLRTCWQNIEMFGADLRQVVLHTSFEGVVLTRALE